MTTGDSFYSKLTRTTMAVALATAVVAGFGITPARADNDRGAQDNGYHNGWNKDKKRNKRDGNWDRNEKGKVRVITPVTPLDRRHRSRTTTPNYGNNGYYNSYPRTSYPSGTYYPNNGGYYNSHPSNGGYYNNGGYYDNRRGNKDPRCTC